jgi:hypothetical protein
MQRKVLSHGSRFTPHEQKTAALQNRMPVQQEKAVYVQQPGT